MERKPHELEYFKRIKAMICMCHFTKEEVKELKHDLDAVTIITDEELKPSDPWREVEELRERVRKNSGKFTLNGN